MTEKKRTRLDAATSKRAEMETCRAGRNPHNNFTTMHGPISRYLLEGQENGLHLRELVSLTGWTEREVRQQIHLERRKGVPILGDNVHGYFFPGTSQERAACVRSMRHRAGEILAAAKAIEEYPEIEGQVKLDV